MKQSDKAKRTIRYSNAKATVAQQDRGFESDAWKLPKGMKRFKFTEAKKYRLNILPYVVGVNQKAGKKLNPYKEDGEVHYELSFFQHPRLGPEDKTFCCSLKVFGKRCVGCEESIKAQHDEEITKEDKNKLRPKHRQLWIVEDLDDKKSGFQIMDQSFAMPGDAGFGQMMNAIIESCDEGDPRLNFFHLKGGQTLEILAKKQTFPGGTFFAAVRIDMIPRKIDYNESVLDKLPCLDDLLIYTPYKDFFKVYFGSEGDDETDETPANENKEPGDEENEGEGEEQEGEEQEGDEGEEGEEQEREGEENEDGEGEENEDGESNPAEARGIVKDAMVKHETLGECKVLRVSEDGSSVNLKTKKGVIHKNMDPDDCDLIEEEQEEEQEDDEGGDDGEGEENEDGENEDEGSPLSDDEDGEGEGAGDDEDDEDDDEGGSQDGDDEGEETPRVKPKPSTKPGSKKPSAPPPSGKKPTGNKPSSGKPGSGKPNTGKKPGKK